MDDKKKILLGENDIIAKSNEDLFINLNLNKTFSEIRNDKFENIFDVSKQFNDERNTSRDFRIYGIIDSTISNCDNLQLFAYDSIFSGTGANSGVTFLSGFVKSFSSSTLVYSGYNTYNKKRGKYILELTGYTHDYIYIKIPSNNSTYRDQIYTQQLIFRDVDNNFVDYGTQTIDIDNSGNIIEINNDFYFLYNKHWIKKDLLIQEEKPAKISFSASPLIGNISEVPSSTIVPPLFLSAFVGAFNFGVGLPVSILAGGFPAIVPFLYQVNIILDKPSPFGLEKAAVAIQSSTINPVTELIFTNDHLLQQNLPLTVSFGVGEASKTFYVFSPQDNLQEFIENITFELKNFQFVSTGSVLTHTINVLDTDSRNRVNLNFQNIYQNRCYFTGVRFPITGTSYSYPMPSVLRNGLYYEGTPMEFYPAEEFTLRITNIGVDTILPVNTILGINSERIFASGEKLAFNIIPQFQNSEKHAIKFYFKNFNSTLNSSIPFIGAGISGLTINAVPIVDYFKSYKVDYEKFSTCFKKTNSSTMFNQNIGGWSRYNLDVPFDIIEDMSGLTITLISKTPGTRLDIKSYGGFPDIFDAFNPQLKTLGLTAETLQSFIYSAQTPLEIILSANFSANTQAQYAFDISKNGYSALLFTSSTLNASVTSPTYYLASGYHDILRNWDNSNNKPVYNHSGVTSDWKNPIPTFGFYTQGEAYVNGILLLSNVYFDTTANTGAYYPNGGALNKSNFTNQTNTYRADFKSTPITNISQTFEFYSPQNSPQIGYLAMREAYNASLPATVSPQRSFDFRTGTTSPFNTYYTGNYGVQYASWYWGTYYGFLSSGGTPTTNHTTNPGLRLIDYLQNGSSLYGVTSQGLTGTTPITNIEAVNLYAFNPNFNSSSHYIKLESMPSVSYEIKNVVELMYTSGPNAGQPFTSSIHPSIAYIESQPSEILGITINKANNFMGGYSLIKP